MSIHPKQAIWKYPIRIDATSTFINVPVDSYLRHIDSNPRLLGTSEDLAVWFAVNPEETATEEREFRPFATGEEIPPYWYYRGTVVRESGLVWHLHERIWND